jgi:hypothetical protein
MLQGNRPNLLAAAGTEAERDAWQAILRAAVQASVCAPPGAPAVPAVPTLGSFWGSEPVRGVQRPAADATKDISAVWVEVVDASALRASREADPFVRVALCDPARGGDSPAPLAATYLPDLPHMRPAAAARTAQGDMGPADGVIPIRRVVRTRIAREGTSSPKWHEALRVGPFDPTQDRFLLVDVFDETANAKRRRGKKLVPVGRVVVPLAGLRNEADARRTWWRLNGPDRHDSGSIRLRIWTNDTPRGPLHDLGRVLHIAPHLSPLVGPPQATPMRLADFGPDIMRVLAAEQIEDAAAVILRPFADSIGGLVPGTLLLTSFRLVFLADNDLDLLQMPYEDDQGPKLLTDIPEEEEGKEENKVEGKGEDTAEDKGDEERDKEEIREEGETGGDKEGESRDGENANGKVEKTAEEKQLETAGEVKEEMEKTKIFLNNFFLLIHILKNSND